MKLSMLCKAALLAATLAFAGVGVAPASAAPVYAQEEVTVYSPYVVKRDRAAGSLAGKEIKVSRVISYRHLDLRYPANVTRLYREIETAAWDVCAQIDRIEPIAFTPADQRSCVRDAYTNARRQADRAVDRANYRY